jgi:hypothetical protein
MFRRTGASLFIRALELERRAPGWLIDRSIAGGDRQMASGGFVEEMMREQQSQSLLEATCGDLFDHIDDLLDFPKEESAADVLLLDAPAPGSPLSARIIDVGGGARGGGNNAPHPAPMEPLMMALPPPAPQGDDDAAAAFFAAAAGAPVFDAKDVGGHIGPVSPPPFSLPPSLSLPHCGHCACARVRACVRVSPVSPRPRRRRRPRPPRALPLSVVQQRTPLFPSLSSRKKNHHYYSSSIFRLRFLVKGGSSKIKTAGRQ